MARLTTQPIVLTAVTFAARMRLAEPGLTLVEEVALKAIGLGVSDVGVLSSLLGLGARPTYDLLHDLWRAGHVLVATGKSRVELAGRARRLFGQGELHTLASAERKVEAVSLVQELLTGGVLPPTGAWRPEGPDSALLPVPMAGLDLGSVPRSALEDALRRALERRARRPAKGQGVRPLKIQELWLDPEQLIQAPTHEAPETQSRRYLNLVADIWMDADARRMRFSLVHAPNLSPPHIRALEQALSERADLDANLLFFKRLREALERKPDVKIPARRADALSRLTEAAGRLDRVDTNTALQRHDDLYQMFESAIDELTDAARHQARTSLLEGYKAHDEALRALARRASNQLVLANPWITLNGLIDDDRGESWFTLIEATLKRGVRVILLWGIREDSELPRDVRSALEDLSQHSPGLLLASRRSSTLHAKVVVADTEEAIVTSYNFLAPPRAGDSLELGLHLRARADGEHPAAVLDLLSWARDRYPEFLARTAIETQPARPLDLAEDLTRPSPPEPPALPEGKDQHEERVLALRVWASEWQRVARHLREQAEGLGAGVRLVRDSAHRELLWEALRESRHRLVVSSDKLAVDVVNDRFARAVRARVEAGVPCAFLYRSEGVSDHTEGPAARLKAIATEAPDLCRVLSARSHTKLMVRDDNLVLGSYNFLSYGAEEGGHSRRVERSELSLSVQDADLVDRALGLLDARSPGAFAGLQGRGARTGSKTLNNLPPSMQGLLRALNEVQSPPDALEQWFLRSTAPWAELDALRRADASPALLERAVLAALAFSSDEGVARSNWQARAALMRWQAADLVGAAVLLPRSGNDLLPTWLVDLGAAVQVGATATAVEAPNNEDEATAALALLVASALTTGNWLVLEGLEEDCWTKYMRHVDWKHGTEAWMRSTGGSPIDLELLQRFNDSATQRSDSLREKESFRVALDDALGAGSVFPIRQKSWDYLREENNFLGVLLASYENDDPARLTSYLDQMKRERTNPTTLMDDAVSKREDQAFRNVWDPKRNYRVQRLNRAWEAAKKWVRVSRGQASTPKETRHIQAARDLQTALDSLARLEPDSPLSPAALRVVRERLRPLLSLDVH